MTRPSTAAPILAGLAILLLLLLVVYVGAYFLMGQSIDVRRVTSGERIVFRRYPHEWQKNVFTPISKVEEWMRGEEFIGIDNPPPISAQERAMRDFQNMPPNYP